MKHIYIILGLWLVMGFLYSDALHGGLVFDDNVLLRGIPDAPRFQLRWLSLETYHLDYLATGMKPEHYHQTSLIVHALSTALVYGILLAWIPETAVWGALLFAVHPVFAQSVQYISARTSSLAAMFIWAALAAMLWLRGRLRAAVIIAAVVCAALSKEEGFLAVPVLFTVWAISNRKRLLWPLMATGAIGSITIPLFIFWQGIPFLSRVVVPPQRQLVISGLAVPISYSQHLQAVINNFSLHLVPALFFPYRLLTDPPLRYGHAWLFAGSLAILAGMVGLILWHRLDYRIRLGLALLLMSPPLSRLLFTIPDTGFEYRTYVCGLGVALLFGLALSMVSAQKRAVLAMACCALFALQTSRRNAIWHDPISFWEETARINPSGRSFNNLGSVYLNVRRFDEAITALDNGLRVQPRLPIAESNLGVVYMLKGDFTQAANHMETAIRESPDFDDAWANYSYLALQMRQPVAAYLMAQRALKINPDSPAAQMNLTTALQMIKVAGK